MTIGFEAKIGGIKEEFLRLNKKLDILELTRIKEILPDYIHKTIKENKTLTEHLYYLVNEEINYKVI